MPIRSFTDFRSHACSVMSAIISKKIQSLPISTLVHFWLHLFCLVCSELFSALKTWGQQAGCSCYRIPRTKLCFQLKFSVQRSTFRVRCFVKVWFGFKSPACFHSCCSQLSFTALGHAKWHAEIGHWGGEQNSLPLFSVCSSLWRPGWASTWGRSRIETYWRSESHPQVHESAKLFYSSSPRFNHVSVCGEILKWACSSLALPKPTTISPSAQPEFVAFKRAFPCFLFFVIFFFFKSVHID